MPRQKKFIVASSHYDSMEPSIVSHTAFNLSKLLKKMFGSRITIPKAEEENGDGQPYITIFDVEKDIQVFPKK